MNCLPCKIALAGRAVAALALLILATAVAAADLFEVRDVEVDVTADSAALARQQAIAQGERKAFEMLLDRLVAGEADVALPEGPQLQALIQDFSIVSEKASAVRYIATMVVRFDADAVRAWMLDQGVPFAARPSEPVVVVPVWEADNSLTLWDDPNPWREAWDESTASASLVSTIVPGGDLQDVAAVTARQALAGDVEALQALAVRHGATDAVVAHARRVADTRSGTTIVAVDATRYGPEGPQWQADVNVRTEPGDDLDTVLGRAVAAVLQELDRRWKQMSTVASGTAAELEVVVPIASLRDWVDVRRHLEDMVVVRDLEVVMMASDFVRARLRYVGDTEQLAAALADAGLTLEESGADWLLHPAARQGAGR